MHMHHYHKQTGMDRCHFVAGAQVYRWADCAGELATTGGSFEVPELLGKDGGTTIPMTWFV